MNALRPLLSAAALVLLALAARGSTLDYIPYRLSELASGADLVVVGTIRDLRMGPPRSSRPASHSGRFRLELENLVAGKLPQGPLHVACFEDWTCAARWTRYAPGQRVMLFLARPEEGSTSYRILSGGGEGEMPLVEQAVFTRGVCIDEYDPVWLEFDGRKVIGELVPLAEMIQAVRGFRETYAWEVTDAHYVPHEFRPRVSAEHAEAFARTSKTAKHLHAEVAPP